MIPDNPISDIFTSSLDKVREFADTETVIGSPIPLSSGSTVIPISKVSLGFASGGLDYPKNPKALSPKNFGGGSGTGVSITPIAFLVSFPDGKVDLLPIERAKDRTSIDRIASLIEKSPDIVSDIRAVFRDDGTTV